MVNLRHGVWWIMAEVNGIERYDARALRLFATSPGNPSLIGIFMKCV